ncbi:Outer membrane porin F precursor [Sporomusa ovata DSM 2662]|uniref:OmpA domain protein n=1 Tax=Sporomusa ovata TaxID=2378 RepID=A0A0U1L0Q6_9FIRM|nr:OmpA family protein [Sporomusa ovata]EQB27416.1 OmpA/MotB domain containing protein [Sporomusa ovata DSM 2662]CQR73260.1 OmpA domain protein [Sporomusa ovata]
MMILRKALLMSLAVFLSSSIAFANQDRGGDAPYFSRMPNSYVVENIQKEYDSHLFTIPDGEISVEGKKTVVEYGPNDEDNPPSALQIIRNYANAAVGKGGTVLYTHDDGTLTARMQSNGKEVWLEVLAWMSGEYRVTIIEKETMRQDVKASDLLTALNTNGHVPLYINFDTGKADIKAEHQTVISEIVALLQQNSGLRLIIEGHTDNVGEPDNNKRLSEQRAQTVMNALKQNGIAAERLQAVGYGQEKPAADNTTDDGRAKNRRVELVKR